MTCTNCGLPMGVGKANAWKPNGTIVGKLPPYLRGNLCDVEELNYLFSSFSERIGFDITRLVIEGKRKDAMIFTRSLLRQLESAGIEPPAPPDFMRVMAKYSSTTGFGGVELVDYEEGESFTIEVESIYNTAMFQGQTAGIFEAIFNKRGDIDWRGDVDHARVRVYAVEGEPELEQAIESEIEALSYVVDEGDIQHEPCPECGAPMDISRDFDWNTDKALSWRGAPERGSFSTTPRASRRWRGFYNGSWAGRWTACSPRYPARMLMNITAPSRRDCPCRTSFSGFHCGVTGMRLSCEDEGSRTP